MEVYVGSRTFFSARLALFKLLALRFSHLITVVSWPFPHWGYRRVLIVFWLRLYPWKALTFSRDNF